MKMATKHKTLRPIHWLAARNDYRLVIPAITLTYIGLCVLLVAANV